MAKKTTDKKSGDKKDTGKKSNAGKDADDSKVRKFFSVGVDPGLMCVCVIGWRKTQGRNFNKRSTHPLRGRIPFQETNPITYDGISQKHSKATEALTKIQVSTAIRISHP